MKIWKLKALVQKIISFLPLKHKINFLFQRYVTRGVQLTDEYFEDKLTHAYNHISYFKKYSKVSQFKVLELGSGWYPVIPIYFYLHNAAEIISIDIAQHINKKNIALTIKKFVACFDHPEFSKYFAGANPDRITYLKSIAQKYHTAMQTVLPTLHIDYQVQDARKTNFEDSYFHLITSNNTFEHIYEFVLADILKEFKRLLHSQGIMSHFIDMSDHFAHLDTSITIYNFLQFSAKQWRWIDNSIQPQNRMRINQYKKLLRKSNLKILEEANRTGEVSELNTLLLAEPYRNFATSDNAVSHSHLVLQ